jgi:hypothetical protein
VIPQRPAKKLPASRTAIATIDYTMIAAVIAAPTRPSIRPGLPSGQRSTLI